MPRRPEPMDLPDDEPPSRANPSRQVPPWAWIAGGLGVVGFIAVPAVAVAIWLLMPVPSKQDDSGSAPAGERVAVVKAPDANAATKAAIPQGNKAIPKTPPGVDLPVVQMDTLAEAYQADRDAAEAKYKGKRLRVEITVRKSGEGWIGTVAQLTRPQMRRISAAQAYRERQEAALRGWVPNVVFHVPSGRVEDHERAVIEGTCAGIAPDASTGLKLTFTNARLIP